MGCLRGRPPIVGVGVVASGRRRVVEVLLGQLTVER